MPDADLDHSVIPAACPTCRHQVKVPRTLAGGSVPCPVCDAPVPVSPPLPRPEETHRVGDLKVADWLGRAARPPA